ncbi:hypothetical protein BG011_001994 [Mortierella polycephala]|uniref:Uncharacterized protein n=1 Tax=Mortierella polycephala TaxID=41804 RepID=A0A9P6Q5E8_9FUNG|nr:hypothetical protein BG011_001994 [Mortierella polycephala]
MTTTTSPIASLTELAKERSSAMSAAASAKQQPHSEYSDRAEPRSMAMNSTANTSASYSLRHQQPSHHAGGHIDEYYEQQQQQHYNSTHSHHSSSSSSSSYYPHSSNGSYLPPPIQTVPFPGHGNGNGNHDSSLYAPQHGHAQSVHGSLVSPTTPPVSSSITSNGAGQVYQQHQQPMGHYDYEHSQAQYHSYHAHHAPYPQEHPLAVHSFIK